MITLYFAMDNTTLKLNDVECFVVTKVDGPANTYKLIVGEIIQLKEHPVKGAKLCRLDGVSFTGWFGRMVPEVEFITFSGEYLIQDVTEGDII